MALLSLGLSSTSGAGNLIRIHKATDFVVPAALLGSNIIPRMSTQGTPLQACLEAALQLWPERPLAATLAVL